MIVRERYMRLIRDFMDKPVIKIITGMRRSGKSALLELTRQELLDRGVDRKNIIFINFESLRYEALRDYKALYAEIIKIAGQTEGRIYVLLDEIQEVNTWEQVINSLRVDIDCDIYVTGSNAKLLSGELATLLAGRYVEIQVYPLDFVSNEHQLVNIYNAVDLFVTPSLEENLPNMIMEAMACGIPCVGFNVGGIPEMIDHLHNGYVAQYKSSEDFANGIYWTLTDPDYPSLAEQACRKAVTHYSESAIAKKYIDLYNKVTGRNA